MFNHFTENTWPIPNKLIMLKIKTYIDKDLYAYSYIPHIYCQERNIGYRQYNDDPGQFYFANMLYDNEQTIIQFQDVVNSDKYEWCYYQDYVNYDMDPQWIKFDKDDLKTYPHIDAGQIYSETYWVTYKAYDCEQLKVAKASFSYSNRWFADYDCWNFDPYDQILYYTKCHDFEPHPHTI